MLVQWNIIMYMQMSSCHWHWCQTNRTYHFSPRYFNGIKIVSTFKYIFEETMPKLSVNFGIKSCPICNFGFTAPQYSDKCWPNLQLKQKCHIFTYLYTQKLGLLYHLRNHPIHDLVGLESVTTFWGGSMIKWRHHCTSIYLNVTLINTYCLTFYMHLIYEWMSNPQSRYTVVSLWGHCSNGVVGLVYT